MVVLTPRLEYDVWKQVQRAYYNSIYPWLVNDPNNTRFTTIAFKAGSIYSIDPKTGSYTLRGKRK